MLTSGHLLADRYRLARRIAVGGMGEVWEAEDARLDRKVAVKVLKAELCGDAEFLHRFRTEARTTASLNHPGVAGVHDYGETNALADGPSDTAYLVMELVEGEPLAAVLARDGRISSQRTLDMLEQAAHALQAAHTRGLVHRDIKPGNILLTPNGVVKLTDFGIAKAADAAPVTRSGMVMGTAHYIAPEQAVGQEASPASDVYSLAVVGYECLMGHRPFRAENAVTVAMMHIRDTPPPLPRDVPPGVRALIEATLVKDPALRYATGGEFAVAVAAVRAKRPVPPPSGHPAAGKPAPGHPQEDHTPPTGVPLSPASALPMPRAPQTPPNPTPMAPVVPARLTTGQHALPMSGPQHQQPDRTRGWLWALLVLLLVLAVTLIVWAIVSANTAAGSAQHGSTDRSSSAPVSRPEGPAQEDPTVGRPAPGDRLPGAPEGGNGGGGGHDSRGDGARPDGGAVREEGPGAGDGADGGAGPAGPTTGPHATTTEQQAVPTDRRHGPAPGQPFDPPPSSADGGSGSGTNSPSAGAPT